MRRLLWRAWKYVGFFLGVIVLIPVAFVAAMHDDWWPLVKTGWNELKKDDN